VGGGEGEDGDRVGGEVVLGMHSVWMVSGGGGGGEGVKLERTMAMGPSEVLLNTNKPYPVRVSHYGA